MNRLFQYASLLLLFAFVISLAPAEAQSRKKRSNKNDEYFDESGGFAHRLWYGGGFALGFSGNSDFSVFNFGLSPMVGYKIVENVSAGPRIAFNYSFMKGYATDGRIHKVQPFSYSVATFARFKFLRSLFAHVEIEFESRESPLVTNGSTLFVLDTDTNKIATVREGRENFYVGLGYTSGSIWGYEILVLYNTTEPDDSLNLPFDIRFAITYNF